MFTAIISTFIGTTHTAANVMNTVFDGSVRMRLKQMRYRKPCTEVATNEDNFLRGQISSSCSLPRIKQANRVGLYYWRNGKENACREFNTLDFPRLQSAEVAYLDLMKQDPSMAGGIDFAELGHGLDLDFFSSFLACSVKDHMRGQYLLSKHSENEGSIFITDSTAQAVNEPKKLERSIVLPVKRIPTGDGKTAVVFRVKKLAEPRNIASASDLGEVTLEDIPCLQIAEKPRQPKARVRKSKAKEINNRIVRDNNSNLISEIDILNAVNALESADMPMPKKRGRKPKAKV